MRPLKYNEPTTLLSKRVPTSKKAELIKLIDDYLSKPCRCVIEELSNGVKFVVSKDENCKENHVDVENITELEAMMKDVKNYNFTPPKINHCNCKLENNIFFKSKGCKLSKEEHKF